MEQDGSARTLETIACTTHNTMIVDATKGETFANTANNGVDATKDDKQKHSKVRSSTASDENPANRKNTKIVDEEFKGGKLWSGTSTVKLKDGTMYEGEVANGEWHGQGKVTYPDGAYYEGAFKKGQRHGWGKITYPDGRSHEGEFKEGKKHGVGKITYPDGRTREAVYKQGMIWNGAGGLPLKDGNVYEGEFVEGKRHGQGEMTYPDGRTLKGEYQANQIWNGTGALLLHDGTSYEGKFRDGKFNGQGKFIYPDGRLLEGEFREGRLWIGTGVLIRRNGIEYEGEFREGKMWSGVSRDTSSLAETRWVGGSMFLNASDVPQDGSIAQFTDEKGAVFDGVYLSEKKKHGQGQIKYLDGSVYEGEWVNNKRHGAGRLTSTAGEVFEGVFVKGTPVSGKGVLSLSSGSKYEGELVQGKRHGLAKITNKEGVVEEVRYDHGKRVKNAELLPHNDFNVEGEWRKDLFHGTRTYSDGNVIEGEFKQSKVYNGVGVVKLKDGAVYEGEISKGKWHGQGKITHPDGRTAEGEFRNSKLWNGSGLTVQGNDLYDGEVSEGKRHGHGQIFYANGSTWQGEFRDGVLWTGKGSLILKDGAVYEGEFKEGFRHGPGKIFYPDGRTLEGEFNQSTIWHGKGMVRLQSGDTYEGEFAAGQRHGHGHFSYLDGRTLTGEFRSGRIWNGTGVQKLMYGYVSTYEGEFRDGKLWNGVATSRDGAHQAQFIEGQMFVQNRDDQGEAQFLGVNVHFTNKHGAVFDGMYVDESRRQGKGQIKYPDGSVYEGEWLKEKRHGAGRLTSAAGEVFEGVFEKDAPVSGKGILLIKNGGTYEGELVEGKRHGRAKITNKEGVVEDVEFAHGKMVTVESVIVPATTENKKNKNAEHAELTVKPEQDRDEKWKAEQLNRTTGESENTSTALKKKSKKVVKVAPAVPLSAVPDAQMEHGAGWQTTAAGEKPDGVLKKDVSVSGKIVQSLKGKVGNKYEGESQQGKRKDEVKKGPSKKVSTEAKRVPTTSVKAAPIVVAASATERMKVFLDKVDQAAAEARKKLNNTL
eukprot:gene18643-biopygen15186